MTFQNGIGIRSASLSPNPAYVRGSLYPQPAVATITTFGNFGQRLLGNSPTSIGTPGVADYYVTLDAINAGYDTGVTDVKIKTLMILAWPQVSATNRALGIGTYHGGTPPPVPQGDTFVLSPYDNVVRAIASTSTGTGSSIIPTNPNLSTDKFRLYFADFTETSVQCHAFNAGAMISGDIAALATRALPISTVRVGVGYNVNTGNGLHAPIRVAASGVWSGTTLTTVQKLQMYNVLSTLLGASITIG